MLGNILWIKIQNLLHLLINSPIFKYAEHILQKSASCSLYKIFSRVGQDCNLTHFMMSLHRKTKVFRNTVEDQNILE